jgi:hypothetical protein
MALKVLQSPRVQHDCGPAPTARRRGAYGLAAPEGARRRHGDDGKIDASRLHVLDAEIEFEMRGFEAFEAGTAPKQRYRTVDVFADFVVRPAALADELQPPIGLVVSVGVDDRSHAGARP